MNATLRVTGAAAFARRLQRFSQDLGRSTESILKQEARSCAVSLCFHTLPYGFGEAPNKMKAKVAGDIRKVYATNQQISAVVELMKPRSQRLAMAYWAAMKKGDDARARKYLRQAGFNVETLDRALHKAARTGKNGSVAKNTTPQQVVKDSALAKFTREKLGTIGTAKAGWYDAAQSLGGRVRTGDSKQIVPAYVRKLARKGSGLGGSRVSKGRIEIFTNVTYADEALPQGSFENAVSAARESFASALARSMAELRKKHFPTTAAA